MDKHKRKNHTNDSNSTKPQSQNLTPLCYSLKYNKKQHSEYLFEEISFAKKFEIDLKTLYRYKSTSIHHHPCYHFTHVNAKPNSPHNTTESSLLCINIITYFISEFIIKYRNCFTTPVTKMYIQIIVYTKKLPLYPFGR